MARVLLLEPDFQLGSMYQQALKTGGHEVLWQRTAQDALHDVDKSGIDIVITELQLALHNGIEFLYEFRSYHEWKHIPILVLSHVSPEQTAIGRSLWEHIKITAYHYKPRTKLADLIESVDKVLALNPA